MSSDFQAEDFPILCETCLGENPYLRMTREKHAKACKICDRPFTVYRWRPGPRSRFKKTEICGTCAKLKNVCQTCILDLQYGLPVQVRDEALAQNDQTAILQKDVLPVSHTNRNYMYEQLEHQVGLGGTNTSLQLPYQQIDAQNGGNPMLQRIQRRGPYYKRNLPHICSFYVRGICNRGDSCPYRHVHPNEEKHDQSLKDQNIKDRFYGVNDPVAKKLMRKYDEWTHGAEDAADGTHDGKRNKPLPKPPMDNTVRTLFIGGIDWSINEDLIRNKFGGYGDIQSVALLHDRKCGFVTFGDRENAEKAMDGLFDKLYLNKRKFELNWARSKAKREDVEDVGNDANGNSNNKEEVEGKEDVNDKDKDKEEVEITEEEKEYLKTKGILPPKLPPMPDPLATSNTGYVGKSSTAYKSMTAHYQEAKM